MDIEKYKYLIYLFILIISIFFASLLSDYLLKQIVRPFSRLSNYLVQKIINEEVTGEFNEEDKEFVKESMEKQGYDFNKIEEAIARLSDNTQMRRDFSANVSHELKSPLTSINGYAEMIATGMAGQDQVQDFASRILKEGNRLLEMIDANIKLAKIDSNQIENEKFQAVDIGSVINENIDSLSLLIKDKNVDVEYEYKRDFVYGNERLLYELVRNLISNAIKYSKDSGAFLKISQEKSKDKLFLIFEDNGIGIPEEDQERIFERFYVVDKSRGNSNGTGLGLALAKNIVMVHKGKISVESKLGYGSKFIIELPYK